MVEVVVSFAESNDRGDEVISGCQLVVEGGFS